MVTLLHDLPGYAATPQDDALATYAAKIDKAEARIDWTLDAPQIERLARALAPFPGAWFELVDESMNERIKQIGRAHVCTPVTNAQLVCSLLLDKKKQLYSTHR